MAGGERVVVEIGVDHRRRQVFGQRGTFPDAVGHDHAAAGENDRKLRPRQHAGRRIERLGTAGGAFDALRLRDLVIAFTVEIVARDVELHRAALGQRDVERARGEFGHAQRRIDVHLPLGDLGENRHLLGFLETAEPHRQAARLGRDRHHRRVRPVGGGDAGHEIGDAGAVLRDAHAVLAGDARIAVGHVRGVLLVGDGNETDAGKRKQIVRIHVGGADDAETVLHALRHQGFDERFAGCHAKFAARHEIFCVCHRVHTIPSELRIKFMTCGSVILPILPLDPAAMTMALVPARLAARHYTRRDL